MSNIIYVYVFQWVWNIALQLFLQYHKKIFPSLIPIGTHDFTFRR